MMKTEWNVRKILTLVILFLLILAAGVLPLVGGTRALGLSGAPGGRSAQFEGELPDGMSIPQEGLTPPGNGDFQPGQMNDNPPEGMDPGQRDGNMQIPQGMGRGGQSDTQMKLRMLSQYALGGVVLLFGLLGIIGLWFNKPWAKIMIVIAGAAALIPAVISLFSVRESLSIVEAVVKLILSVSAIGLTFLPAGKAAFQVEDIS